MPLGEVGNPLAPRPDQDGSDAGLPAFKDQPRNDSEVVACPDRLLCATFPAPVDTLRPRQGAC